MFAAVLKVNSPTPTLPPAGPPVQPLQPPQPLQPFHSLPPSRQLSPLPPLGPLVPEGMQGGKGEASQDPTRGPRPSKRGPPHAPTFLRGLSVPLAHPSSSSLYGQGQGGMGYGGGDAFPHDLPPTHLPVQGHLHPSASHQQLHSISPLSSLPSPLPSGPHSPHPHVPHLDMGPGGGGTYGGSGDGEDFDPLMGFDSHENGHASYMFPASPQPTYYPPSGGGGEGGQPMVRPLNEADIQGVPAGDEGGWGMSGSGGDAGMQDKMYSDLFATDYLDVGWSGS